MRSPPALIRAGRSSPNGESGSSNNAFRGLRSTPAPAARGFFPPELVLHGKALACELHASLGIPLSRLSVTDGAKEARRTGLVARISDSTVWGWLSDDVIRPGQHRCSIFPRDPDVVPKASRILDLYERVFEEQPLKDSVSLPSNGITRRSRSHSRE